MSEKIKKCCSCDSVNIKQVFPMDESSAFFYLSSGKFDGNKFIPMPNKGILLNVVQCNDCGYTMMYNFKNSM